MPSTFQIGGVEVQPGQRLTVDLPVARFYTHTEMTMPVHVICGKKDGPALFVSAAIHGDEICGVEIIRRMLKRKILQKLRGTLIAIPVVNVYGFLNQSRYLPDRRDLNRFFPGSDTGSLTSRLAHLFMQEIVGKCTHGIDLHTGSNHRTNLPQIRAYLEDPETERLAQAFGAPVVLDADFLQGSLRQAAKDKGIKMLLYEAGEVLRFDEVAIRVGIRGILSVMHAIGMLRSSSQDQMEVRSLISRSSTWVRAPISGILHSKIRLGEWVKLNSKIAKIADPFGEDEAEVVATASGVVIGRLKIPLVHRGDALIHIARIASPASADDTLEAFRHEFEPEGM